MSDLSILPKAVLATAFRSFHTFIVVTFVSVSS